MSSNLKHIILNDPDQVKDSSNVWWDYLQVNRMCLEWTINDTNETYTSSGWYGDACATHRSFEADDDILVSIGYGDGFAVRRLNDDGTLTNIYYDNTPMDNYSNYVNFTIDRTNHRAYIGNNYYDGIMVYDYSGCLPTGTTVTKVGEINPTYDECGYYYTNGIYIVGDYLYLQPDEASTSVCRRYNVSTSSQDDLTVTNRVYNGRYGEVRYDKDNNRIYMVNRIDGGIWVVINPDKASDDATNPAKCYAINLSSLGVTNDIYAAGLSVDKDNANYLWVVGYHGRYIKIDITDVLNETDTVPTLLDKNDLWYNKSNNRFPFVYQERMSMDNHPIFKSDLLLIRPAMGWNIYFGWFDKDDKLPITTSYKTINDDTGSVVSIYTSSDMVKFDYASFPIRMQSSGGTYYWIVGGYGGDGGKFRMYSDSYSGLTLHTSGYITFGDFQLDSNQKIRTVKIENLKDFVHEPTNCSFDVKVSNNSGTDWEIYDWNNEDNHFFYSTGNTMQIKFEFTGYNGIKSPYIISTDMSKISISFSDEYGKDNNVKNTRFKIG